VEDNLEEIVEEVREEKSVSIIERSNLDEWVFRSKQLQIFTLLGLIWSCI